MRIIMLAAAGALAGADAAGARPVSYEGGWTVMAESDREMSAALLHYTPHYRWSLGVKSEWMRDDDVVFAGVQATWLAHRWFGENYQANLYAFAAGGAAEGVGANPMNAQGAGMIGVMADWTTRRWSVSWRASAADMGDGVTALQAARAGFAPYVAGFGELDTRFLVEIDQRPENNRPVAVTPMVQFSRGAALLELGWTPAEGTAFTSFVYLF